MRGTVGVRPAAAPRFFFIRRPCLRNIRAPRVCGPPCARPAISVRPQPRFGYASPAVVFYAGISRACGCVSVRQFSSPFSAMQMAALGPVASARNSARRFASGPGCSAVRRGARAAAKCGVLRQCCVRGAGSELLHARRPKRPPRRAAARLVSRRAAPVRPFGFCNDRAGGMVFPRAPLSLFAAFYSRAARLHTPAASRFTPPGSRRLPVAPAPATPCACHALRPPRPAPAPAVSLPGSSAYVLRRICGSRIFQIPHKQRRGNAPPLLFCGISPLLLPHDRKT